MAIRSDVGVAIVRRWGESLPQGGAVVDVGCGSGVPIAVLPVERGFLLFGVGASPVEA